jgi:predicted Fe-Mo cluster-binding NifX family protein
MRKIKVGIGTGRPGTRIAQHAGKTRFFVIYEITENDKGKISVTDIQQVELDENQTLHEMLHRIPINFENHPLEDVEIILTGSIGYGAMQKLWNIGKRAYMVEERTPEEAIKKLIDGTLQAKMPSTEHHHHHHHDHDCKGEDCK